MLKKLGTGDRGIYRCIADNAVRPPAMFDSTLYVQFQPYARAVQTTYGQAQNRLFDILLECRISGASSLRNFRKNFINFTFNVEKNLEYLCV